mmetsp:Transcript_17969/g.14557  ORF Transcript_17969/g.14557 Transcript_17969/m.14557 type:complete len:99 (+) Transcript_17969:2-298(+)
MDLEALKRGNTVFFFFFFFFFFGPAQFSKNTSFKPSHKATRRAPRNSRVLQLCPLGLQIKDDQDGARDDDAQQIGGPCRLLDLERGQHLCICISAVQV